MEPERADLGGLSETYVKAYAWASACYLTIRCPSKRVVMRGCGGGGGGVTWTGTACNEGASGKSVWAHLVQLARLARLAVRRRRWVQVVRPVRHRRAVGVTRRV